MNETSFSDFVSLIRLIPDMDVDYAIEAIGGSEPLYEKVLIRIVRLIQSNIEQMDQFLDKDEALNDFAIKVHGVKSSMRQAGYLKLALRAEALEKSAKDGDRLYCTQHYAPFREDLLHFRDQVDNAISQSTDAETKSETGNVSSSNLGSFFDVLDKVKAAAAAYDTLSASELLSPLTKMHFGENEDILITKAMDALDVFKPKQALEFIAELMEKR